MTKLIRATVVSAALVLLALGSCSSDERVNFGEGEISDDGGSVRTWTAHVNDNTACIEVSGAAEACIDDLDAPPEAEIDVAVDATRGSSAIIGRTPPDARSVAVRYSDGSAQSVVTESNEAGGLIFAWAIDFAIESVPVTIQALDADGNVLDETTIDLAIPS